MNGAFMGSPNPIWFLLPGADTVMGLFLNLLVKLLI